MYAELFISVWLKQRTCLRLLIGEMSVHGKLKTLDAVHLPDGVDFDQTVAGNCLQSRCNHSK